MGQNTDPGWDYGAHIFYRLPGGAGAPKAFYDSYRGGEPTPGPRAKIGVAADPLVFQVAGEAMPQGLSVVPPVSGSATGAVAATPPVNIAADRRYVAGALPESDVRDEYRNSGQWIAR